MDNPVSEIAIKAVSAEGRAFRIELAIGKLYRYDTGEWACSVSLRGLRDHLALAHGVDSFQALCMAISLAQDLLQDFREKGGKLLMGSKDFPLEAYAFGIAARRQP